MTDSRVHELLSGLTVVIGSNDFGFGPKRSLNGLPESRAKSEHRVSSSPQVIIYTRKHDGDHGLTFVSENVQSRLGHDPEQFVRQPSFWVEHIHSDDAANVVSDIAKVLETGHHVHEYRFMHNDGGYRWMRDEMNLVRDNTGKPVEILGSWVDITEQKEVKKELRESEARYRSLVDSAPMGMVSFDDRGEITEFNPALLQILGAPLFEATDAKELFSVLPIVEAGISEAIFRCLESGEPSTGEFQYKTKVDREVYTRLHVVPIRGSDGRVCGAHAFVQDLSDQKRAEGVIVSSERLKVLGQIATGVGHTFNNLLQIVSGNANMALTNLELKDEEGIRANLEQILQSVQSATEAVRWMQQFGREPSYGLVRRKTVFDVTQSVEEAVEMCKLWSKTDLSRKNIQISYELELTPGCHIEGVPDQMVWVVLNLLKNAVEAMPTGGFINIKSFVKDDKVNLTVHDTGIGIPEENVQHVTTAFWTSKRSHAGMGLTFNAWIVRQHGGTIGLKRMNAGGTTFVVRVPHVTDPVGKKRALLKEAYGKGLRVLCVDDNERVLRILEEGLRALGQTPIPASSGRQALKMLEEKAVDAVVCDLVMEGTNGWEVARAVAKLYSEKGAPKPPFIILTGFARQLGEEEIRGHPEVDRILEKPIQVPQLLEIITDEVQKASANATFSGRVNGVDLLEYMQLLLLNGQQVVLEILSTDGAEGFIFLDKGEILHATCGKLEGEEALYRLLTFKGGSFSSLPWRPIEKATINKPAQFLLIEAARKRDDIRSTAKPTSG